MRPVVKILLSILFETLFVRTSVGVDIADNSKWIIIEDVGIENEYFEFQYYRMKSKELNFDAKSIQTIDEFFHWPADELAKVCSKLKNVKIYQRTPLKLQFPVPSNLPESDNENEKEIKYAYRPVKSLLGRVLEEVPVFRCETHKNKTYWLTYGYSPSSIYLLREVDDGKALQFVGKSERLPKVDKDTSRGEELDGDFLESYEPRMGFDYSDINLMNPFANAAMFRLCCLVHAVKQNENPDEESFTLNYANSDSITTGHIRIELQITDTLAPEYEKYISATTIGCVINRKKEGEVNFFIHSDGKNASSLFVLDKTKEDAGKDINLFVAERVFGLPCQNRQAFHRLLSTPIQFVTSPEEKKTDG